MELFVVNEAIARFENELAATQGDSRLAAAVALAWHLRQRDCQRSSALAIEADGLLLQLEVPEATRCAYKARLGLMRAEIELLFGNWVEALRLAKLAGTAFENLGDLIGIGDTHWFRASIWVDHGTSAQVAECLDLAASAYQLANDPIRLALASARRLVNASFREPAATAPELFRQFPLDQEYAVCVAAWVATARANVAGLTNDPVESIRNDLAAYHAALESGQIRQALVAASNAAESFATLGDFDAALEWAERAMVLARKTGWPASIGSCLVQLGDVMRLLQRHDESRDCLQEALTLMAGQAGSRNYELCLANFGQLALDGGNFEAGLESFNQLEGHLASQVDPDLTIRAWRGQARALFHLGRVQEAERKASAALALAQQHRSAEEQIQVLRILAQMYLEQALAPPIGMTAPNAALEYYAQALEVAATMGGYEVSSELLAEVAQAHAAAGNFEAAYKNSLASSAARSKSRRLAAQKRALALQVRREVDQAHADAEYHRRLAATLKETASTLETLGIIGREITASLDASAVFEALHRHVHRLLDATTFVVYLLEENQQFLRTAFGIEAGVLLPVSRIDVNSATATSARCVRERKEVLIEIEPGVITANLIPGTLPTYSLLYAPLMVGERLLGVMTIQSAKPKVYGERERSIFHTLCAYGAIALDNASAYKAAAQAQQRAALINDQLLQTQAQLVQDIAERKRIDQELNELNKDLEARITQRTQEMRATLTLQKVLYLIAERAAAGLSFYDFLQSVHGLLDELLYAKNCYVCLYDAQKGTKDFPYYVDERDGDKLQLSDVPYRRGLTEFVLRTQKPQLIDANRLKELEIAGEVTEGSGDMSFSSWLGVPMQIRGAIGGILAVQAYEPGIAYSASDTDVLSFVANHVSSAIERYQALDELRKSEERYRTVIENVGVGVVVVQEGRMVFANPSLVRIVGHPLAYLLSQPFTATVHPDDVPTMVERHQRRLRGEAVEQLYGFRCVTQAGEVRSLELSAVKIEWNKRAATLMFVVDATARLQAEKTQLLTLQRQAELNSMKSRFISMASHEFRTPLSTIRGSVELLQHYGERLSDDKKQMTLQKVDEAVQRMTHMLENVLLIGRSDSGQLEFNPRPLAITPFCMGLVDELRSSMTSQYSHIRLTLELPDPSRQFLLDEMLVRNIVGNLLSNALKYSPERGEVCFTVRELGDQLLFVVSDQGIGIPQADQAHLFESFHRAGNVGAIAGTGLGLSIVKNAVICHRGRIEVHSEVGQGSRFTVSLPVSTLSNRSTSS